MGRKAKKKEEGGGYFKWGLIIFAALVLWTCPDKEAHLKEIRRAIEERVSSNRESAMSAMMLAAIGGGDSYVSTIMSALEPEFTSFWIFSVTTCKVNGKIELLSIGACGEVGACIGD